LSIPLFTGKGVSKSNDLDYGWSNHSLCIALLSERAQAVRMAATASIVTTRFMEPPSVPELEADS